MKEEQIIELTKAKDNAYWERNQLVLALTKIFPSHLMRHEESDKNWENDWRWIVAVEIPTKELEGKYFQGGYEVKHKRQLTWHIHDSEYEMFKHLAIKHNDWDGHTTEEKYKRLRHLEVPKLAKMLLNKIL